MNNIYSTPASPLASNDQQQPRNAGLFLKLSCIALTVLTMLVAAFKALALESQIGEIVGYALGPIIWGIIIVGLFQIGKRFRNQKSRYKIYLWCQIVFFVTQTIELVKLLITLGSQI